jgi:hypothetical protein
MSRALWALFYLAGFLGLALMLWRGVISAADSLEHMTRPRDKR